MPALSSSSVNIDPIIPMEDRLQYDRHPCRWRLRTCCFFVSLRSGCYGISILSMMEALLYMTLTSSVLFLHPAPKCDNTDDVRCRPTTTKEANVYEFRHSNHAVVLVLLIMCVYFLVSALLFYGIKKRRPKLLSPWLWWSFGEMLITFLSIGLVERSFSLLLKVYCCFIVCSYIDQLKEEQREEEIVTYVSVRNGRPGTEGGGRGGVASLSGGPHYPCPAYNEMSDSSGINPYVPTHVFIPTATSHDESLVKMESFNSSRMYGGQRPPPYSPPLAGFVATTSSGEATSSAAVAEEGAVGGTVITTTPASIMTAATDPAVVTDAAAVAAVSGINSNNSMLPLLPPSYEEAIRDSAVALDPHSAPPIFSPPTSALSTEEETVPQTAVDSATTPTIPDSLPQQEQQSTNDASDSQCGGATAATKPTENASE